MTDSHLHIAIASDENYAPFAAGLMASVADHNSSFNNITFHLLSNGIPQKTLKQLVNFANSLSKSPRGGVFLNILPIEDLQNRLGIEVPNTIALTSYARLFLAQLLPESVHRILYLDTDIIVNDDLGRLWDLGGNEDFKIGGVLDIFEGTASKTDVGLQENAPYVNSGVLLINVDHWRKDDMARKFMDFLYAHDGHVHHHDQGIINGTYGGNISILPPEYNVHTTVLSHPYKVIAKIADPHYSEEALENAKRHPAIIHFTEGFLNRPWRKNCRHPYKHLFLKYSGMTPWRGAPLQADNRSLAVKMLSFSFLHLSYGAYKRLSATLILLKRLLHR